MAKPLDDFLRKPLYVYDLPPKVLDNISLKSGDRDTPDIPDDQLEPHPVDRDDGLVGAQSCSLCSLTFSSLEDQRSHQRSDLHRYNLKQKLRGLKPVTETDFEKLIGDLDESLSGSDTSEDDDGSDDGGKPESTLTLLLKRQARLADKTAAADDDDGGDDTNGNPERSARRNKSKAPLIWFGSPLLPDKTYFGLYRSILTGEEQRLTDLVEVLRKKQIEPIVMPRPAKDGSIPDVAYKGPHMFLCMIGGGHFAAMVVSLAPRPTKSGATTMNREATVLAHKTFHRYTTRRKQGGSQSANDNAKGNAHSAGSDLRRYNEQALVQDVRSLLTEWKGLIDTSELLFVRATGSTNRRTLFGPYDGQVLRHNDSRLRSFPFSTRRATQNELMRSFIELTRLKVREIDQAKAAPPPSTTKETSKPASQKPATKPKLSEEEETALLHTSQLQAFVRRSKVPALLSYLKSNGVSPDFTFHPPEGNHHAPTPLHLAASHNSAPLVLGLLVRAGASPLVRNRESRTAFDLAGDRATRDAFRVARHELGESKWNWDEANIPPAMSKADADVREERDKAEATRKEVDRRKAEEQKLREQEKEQPSGAASTGKKKHNALAAGLAKTPQEKREEEARGLTPEMRMKLERERRARAAEARMRSMQGR
ncbi:C2H2 finger and ankyrin domain protein [Geosmithia morbida]|uniref:C2H2 finger and ankyrin domain protein n=1 Tax=Geosmithia morbida TaxID=1094350 RepID=A0A9P5D344_9HYPO|nr:C2H2 finger and ankyrin domain protein [Geosmithia morbida]KAF4124532.1 C2H2 finger and ankyrin domain protein [Geosmithia morbida]